jgi:phytoene synthase
VSGITVSQRAAERFCARMARREAANFYWGFLALPHDQRVAIYALYDFAREVDDAADLGAGELDAHRARLRRCLRGEYDDEVTAVLRGAVSRYRIPGSELEDLIRGVETDLIRTRYQTWPELAEYCRLVASVVGRMCVRVFGFSDAVALWHADRLGLALQLVNILRDVREDSSLGRIYLPQEDLRHFDVTEAALLAGEQAAGWEPLVAFEAARARSLFAEGLPVTRYIPRRAAACVLTMAGIYERLLARIERDPGLPLRRRARLSAPSKLAVLAKAWLRAA